MPSLGLSSLLLVLVLSLASARLRMVSKDEHGVITFSTGTTTYKLHTEHFSWDEAQSICRQDQGDLTVIKSSEDAEYIESIFSYITDDNVKYISVGITDRSTEGTWMTVEGELVSSSGFNSWAVGEPGSQTGDEDCGVLNRNKKYLDVDCANKNPFICQSEEESNSTAPY